MFEFILIANAIWFGLGFHLFSIRSDIFAKIIVSKEHRDTPVFDVLSATGPFLGGFNFAFCALSLLLFFNANIFAQEEQKAILFFVFALAHGSQFVGNVPIALENRKGKGVWQVQRLMLFIFVTDCVLMIVNAGYAALSIW
jgi:hypothetical protein